MKLASGPNRSPFDEKLDKGAAEGSWTWLPSVLGFFRLVRGRNTIFLGFELSIVQGSRTVHLLTFGHLKKRNY